MAKKIIWVLGIFLTLLVLIVVVIGVVVYVTVDKKFVESKLAQVLNRHVTIESVNVSILSVFSGIEVKRVSISHFKTPDERAKLAGKPVSSDDTFARLEALRFKMKFLPLLKREVEVKELVIIRPMLNLIKNKDGTMNVSDLIVLAKGEEIKEKKEDTPSRPVSADMIPAAVSIGEIGFKEGTINYYDAKLGQTFQLYDLTFLLHGIEIDPRDLEKKNEIKLTFHTGLKTVDKLKTESIQSFDVVFDTTGQIIPFDKKTRLLDPEIILHISCPEGQITGLKIFDTIASIPILGEYLGEYLSFLKGTQKWKASRTSGVEVRYKADHLYLKKGRLDLSSAQLSFFGEMNTKTKAVDMDLGITMSKKVNDAVKGSVARKIASAIPRPEIRKYVNPDSVAQAALKPLLDEEGSIFFVVKVSGTTEKPSAKIIKPELKPIAEWAKDAASQVTQEVAKEVIKEKAKDLLPGSGGRLLEGVGDLIKNK
ncbi:MAG: AsmA family protein [Syntrophales bacterium]|nr:AsmA family protein [Syntrophales bacterium]